MQGENGHELKRATNSALTQHFPHLSSLARRSFQQQAASLKTQCASWVANADSELPASARTFSTAEGQASVTAGIEQKASLGEN